MKTFKDQVKATADNLVSSDLASKTLFNDTYQLLKDSKVANVESSLKGLLTDAKEVLEGNYSKSFNDRIYKTIKYAAKWYQEKLFTNHKELYYYNIEGGIKLLLALDKLKEVAKVSEEDTKRVRNKLNRIKFGTTIQYNDEFQQTLKEFMLEFKLSDVDGKIVSLEKSLDRLWDIMTQEQKQAFADKINNKLKPKETFKPSF